MCVRLVLKCFALISALFFSVSLYAETQFRVIVDASGSMVISDPDKLTSESLRLIADLSQQKGASLGVWLFGEEPRVLLPEAKVTPEHRQRLASYVDSYITSDVKTDLEAILELLLQDELVGQDYLQKHWILVTDGMVDISLNNTINNASRERIKGELLDQLVKRGIHLHTISMTGYTDKALLKALSSKTNATHTEIALPEELLPTFNKIFSLTSSSDQIPFEDNAFFIDESVDEFTLLAFHELDGSIRLLDAKGARVGLSSSSQSSNINSDYYSLITVLDPMAGTWRLEGADVANSKLRVVTNLSAQAEPLPIVVFQEEPFSSSLGLYQEGKAIQAQAFLDVVQVSQSLNKKNGEFSDLITHFDDIVIQDFQYKSEFDGVSVDGAYELVSFIDGGSFTREVIQHISVVSPIELELKVSGLGVMSYLATPSNSRLDVLRSRLTLEITSSEGVVQEEELRLTELGYWEKVDLDPEAIFSIRMRLDAITQAGVSFTYWSNYWDVDRTQPVTAIVERLDVLGNKVSVAEFELDSQEVVSVFTPSSLEINEVIESDESVVEESSVSAEVTDQIAEITAGRVFKEISEWQEEAEVSADTGLYVAIGVGGIFVLMIGYFLYRRTRHANLEEPNEKY